MLIIKTCSELAELSNKSVVQTIGKKNRAAPHRLFNLKFWIWNLEVRTWKLELGI